MNDQKLMDAFNSLHKSVAWGEYVLGQFYFRVNTRKSKSYYGIENGKNKELLPESQKKIQGEHGFAMFHEYIHYLHEVSTQVGAIGFSLEFLRRALISQGINSDLKSSELPGITDSNVKNKFVKTITSNGVLMGSQDLRDNMGYFNEVKAVDYEIQVFYAPEKDDFREYELKIPSVTYEFINNGTAYTESIKLGKFYLYEGIAYELEQEYERRVKGNERIIDPWGKSEYTVLRDIAKYYAPDIEKIEMLTIGSLSLSYLNCGEMFIKFLEDYSNRIDEVSSSEIIESFRAETVKSLNGSVEIFEQVLIELMVAAKGRYHLEKAYQYLSSVYLEAYRIRCKIPDIEIQYFFEGKLSELFEMITICDQMFLFEESDEFLKDVIGSTLEIELAEHLKIHQSWAHYLHSHQFASTENLEKNKEVRCPFYTSCDLNYRENNKDICNSKPWRIYEVGVKNNGLQCWYGLGVMEHKGLTTKGK